MKRLLLAGLLLVLTGCGVNSTFVYKPAAPVVDNLRLPVKVAVVAFVDGTEDFTKRGSIFAPENLTYNLAKAGWGGVITALTPELWAKAFAEELATMGVFRSVRFVYGESELVDEEIRIEGIVKKATLSGAFEQPNEFAIEMRAFRRAENKTVWEKSVTRIWSNPKSLYDGCGVFSIQCMVDRHKADANRVMHDIFVEAGADLVRTLASTGSRGEHYAPRPAASPQTLPAGETVDREIERILKGN